MTTCRLLCALLVLALCCCPFVCVRASAGAERDGHTEPPTPSHNSGLGANSLGPNARTVPKTNNSGGPLQSVSTVAGGEPDVSSNTPHGAITSGQSGSEDGDTDSPGSTVNSEELVVKKTTEHDPAVPAPNEEVAEKAKNAMNATPTKKTPPLPISAVPQPKASPAVTVPETGKGSAARNLSQLSREKNKENTASQTKALSEALKRHSGDAEAEQQEQESDTSNLVAIADNGKHAETTSSSISINDNDDSQGTGAENNDNDPRPNPTETSDHKVDNTNLASAPTETAPETVNTATAERNETLKSEGSDGSTAVSHATSPLLLLLVVVACAAAAAVAA
ncbi:Mucin-associated surface protein (MASP) [Trypanosoma cruzi]|uniref:Mucin-associated surface protein (MASP), putative n=2 Tax=Trypanosoma cruzi TaxID=5693 RepID=Q4DXA2_TRYCC|nr:mucin-associated surface protein (MASP), putative [Trypanosoma cruzi]EAN97157.1 mucin-associated surface protein (MASP), putative [Trypanosoma cruzi]PWV15320.1 Mucin-associated surface protein (MASP) [Trypanosoma cruzi]|eukprot:XP_819008.1 mucin-associated surface protein (MASP) [Trypanosoma cruzi strain CL Brener]